MASRQQLGRVEADLHSVMSAKPRDPVATATALERAVALARTPEGAQELDLAELLSKLADTYEELGRVEDALTAARQMLDAGYSGSPDGRCRVAEILMRAGRLDEAEPIWAEVEAATPGDVWLYNNAGIEYQHAGDPETALRWLSDGLRLALSTGDPERLVDQLAEFRRMSLTSVGADQDELQTRAEKFLAAPPSSRPSPAPRPEPASPQMSYASSSASARSPYAVALAWFPASEYEQALRRWPDLAEAGGPAQGGREHTAYCRAMQVKLAETAEGEAGVVGVAPIRVEDFVAWCGATGEDPATAPARARYAAELAGTGAMIRWPPGRNQPCWCGSGRKYKKCCAAPSAAVHTEEW